MKIASIEAIPLHATLSKPFKFGHVIRLVSANVVIKITGEDGAVGWGEACPVPQLTGETQQSIVDIVDNRLAPLLVGVEPLSWRSIMTRLESSLVGYTFTRAAIETALLDLVGRSIGAPIWQVLGGRFREEIELHGSVGWDSDTQTVVDEVRRQAAEFRTIKLYVGPGDLDADLRTVAAVRGAVPDEIDFIVDVNGLWSRSDAVKAASRLAEAGVSLLEQPLPPADLEGAQLITKLYRDDLGIDIAMDEGLRTARHAARAGAEHSASIATIAMLKLGGPATALHVAITAAEYGLGVMVGSVVELGIATAAGVHLAACIERLDYPGYLMGPRKYSHQVTAEKNQVIDGRFIVPTGVGLGVEIDEEMITSMDLRRTGPSIHA